MLLRCVAGVIFTERFMKNLILSITFLVFSSHTLAKAAPSTFCNPRVPAIELATAIQLVHEHHKVSVLKDKEIFIDDATLQCQSNMPIWLVGYRLKAYNSGHVFVTVQMDGSVKLKAAVKDG